MILILLNQEEINVTMAIIINLEMLDQSKEIGLILILIDLKVDLKRNSSHLIDIIEPIKNYH